MSALCQKQHMPCSKKAAYSITSSAMSMRNYQAQRFSDLELDSKLDFLGPPRLGWFLALMARKCAAIWRNIVSSSCGSTPSASITAFTIESASIASKRGSR
jgi:hypothetical protein